MGYKEGSFTPESEIASQHVGTFLWKLWHPVPDATTHAQRAEAVTTLLTGYDHLNISPNEYIAMIHGSLQWLTANSDNDFKVIRLEKSPEAERKFMDARWVLRKEYNTDTFFGTQTVDPTALLKHDYSHVVKHLLLTPDDYIAGNIQEARNIRLAAVEQIADDPQLIDALWDGKYLPSYQPGKGAQGGIEGYFRHSMRDWALKSEGEDDKKRVHRMQDYLRLPRSPWIKPEELPLFNLTVPEFAVYSRALRESKGALTMRPPLS